jgi:hypothetical protein
VDEVQRAPLVGLGIAHAYTPNERGHYGGSEHVVVAGDLRFGRLLRSAGDALCRPARRFWGLQDYPRGHQAPATCTRCIDVATRLVLAGIAAFNTP